VEAGVTAIYILGAALALALVAAAVHWGWSAWAGRLAAKRRSDALRNEQRARAAADEVLAKAGADVARADAAAAAQAERDSRGTIGDWLRGRGAGQ
jgi:hypothetical protein